MSDPISRHGTPHQVESLQATTRAPAMITEPDEANPDVLGVSQGGRETTLMDGSGSRHESLSGPLQAAQFNLQGNHLSGNTTIVSGNLTQITNIVQPRVPEQKVENILDWLAPNVNFRSIYIQNLEKCTEGTLSWFLKGDDYDQWKKGDTKVIWGTGIPGAGKTVLA
ncbi:ankyrin repeat domain-containing protein 50 [Coprinopsis cinerea AmutBmut pab1-1]|nr:ankyrin repeat domain-containing protein 50 [Coprinopsis cinerea AmutBmut pab1-1]